MPVEFGVLLPTREAIMSGRPETAPMLAMAERAEAAGFDSVWIGDSLTARPRHEPLTLLAAVAGRTRRLRLGTAVLLPALRSPVGLAQVVGTPGPRRPSTRATRQSLQQCTRQELVCRGDGRRHMAFRPHRERPVA